MAGEARLMRASLRGDHDAFARIVRRYQALVCAITYSGTGDLDASEDLAQETFLTAWKRLGSLREPSRLSAWLCTIARNLTTDYLRRRQHDVAARAESVENAPAIESALPTPVEQATAKERELVVWDALRKIPETYRVPLVLYYREEQSARRVARDLQISSAAVRQRLARGREMLRDKVAALVEETLSTTAPGSTFAAAVLAGLGATAAEKGAGGGFTIFGLSLAKAASLGVLAIGAAMGAAMAIRPEGQPQELPASAAPTTATEPVDITTVIERIQARANAIKTVQATWALKMVVPKDSRQDLNPSSPAFLSKWPAHDTELEYTGTLTIDGGDVFYDWTGWLWVGSESRFRRAEIRETLVDGVSSKYDSNAKSGRATKGDFYAKTEVDAYPFFMAYRLFDPTFGYLRPEEVRLLGVAERDGHPCVVVGVGDKLASTWWLAQDQDYCPVHVEWRRDGTLTMRFDLRYVPDEEIGWRLQSWDWMRPAGGDKLVPMHKSAEFVETTINEPVDRHVFEVLFPAGTSVRDDLLDVQYTVNEEPQRNGEALCRAARQGDLEEVERLVAEKADVNLPGPAGRTALHFAAELGHVEVIRALLAHGADVSARDDAGCMPLHLAAEAGHRDVIEALLAAGADVNATDLQGRTPTGLAVQNGHEEVAELLCQHGGVE